MMVTFERRQKGDSIFDNFLSTDLFRESSIRDRKRLKRKVHRQKKSKIKSRALFQTHTEHKTYANEQKE
jgi:hypothetical protein